jgi:hypothetical protein
MYGSLCTAESLSNELNRLVLLGESKCNIDYIHSVLTPMNTTTTMYSVYNVVCGFEIMVFVADVTTASVESFTFTNFFSH